MQEFDKDLRSIQEARDLSTQAFAAWKIWSHASQEQVDRVCAAMSAAALAAWRHKIRTATAAAKQAEAAKTEALIPTL